MTDIELGGQPIKEGDKVVIWYIAANRDETVFDDPYASTSSARPNEHVAFGGGGPHFCLGANLARMEINVMFEELLDRLARHRAHRAGEPPPLELHQRHQAHPAHVPLRP